MIVTKQSAAAAVQAAVCWKDKFESFLSLNQSI
jgi:hypothetical protein